ncbi:hypothetical protein K435DRAFT_865729 [Dendrothele bispora CBS 962.96]|uniref:Uncharacterized protein n=1 Tax=Dendrothele bispora (strain CBS 962.96) TaxID=1314807 RepID=A0A4S8LIP3_DENBC|nr:hypothetical protein K435DRAFT_865729 [Dendrothele bispora CBS 962.96]
MGKFIEFKLAEDDYKLKIFATHKYPDWTKNQRASGKLIRARPSIPAKRDIDDKTNKKYKKPKPNPPAPTVIDIDTLPDDETSPNLTTGLNSTASINVSATHPTSVTHAVSKYSDAGPSATISTTTTTTETTSATQCAPLLTAATLATGPSSLSSISQQNVSTPSTPTLAAPAPAGSLTAVSATTPAEPTFTHSAPALTPPHSSAASPTSNSSPESQPAVATSSASVPDDTEVPALTSAAASSTSATPSTASSVAVDATSSDSDRGIVHSYKGRRRTKRKVDISVPLVSATNIGSDDGTGITPASDESVPVTKDNSGTESSQNKTSSEWAVPGNRPTNKGLYLQEYIEQHGPVTKKAFEKVWNKVPKATKEAYKNRASEKSVVFGAGTKRKRS